MSTTHEAVAVYLYGEVESFVFFHGEFIIVNDYLRMYIVKHHHTWGELRLVRRGFLERYESYGEA